MAVESPRPDWMFRPFLLRTLHSVLLLIENAVVVLAIERRSNNFIFLLPPCICFSFFLFVDKDKKTHMMNIIPGREWIVWVVAIAAICLFVMVLLWCWHKNRCDSYTSTSSASISGYYRLLTATEQSTMGQNMINVWIDYKNLPYHGSASGNIKSFTGIYQVGSTTTTAITFLSNITPIPSADFGNTPVVYMPIPNQSGTFCMPLIPFSDTAALSTMSFGYQITFNDGTPAYTKTVSYGNMTFLPMHIFDGSGASGDLPVMTPPSSLSVTIPSTPSSATLTQLQTAMNSGKALYMPEIVATSDSTTFLSNLGSMIYINSNSTQDQKPDSAGMWFSASANGTPAYYSSTTQTPYLLLTTKFDSYPISGMIATTSTASYSITSSSDNSLSISFNSMPIHPTGLFPSQFQSPNYQVSAYCGPNPNSVDSQSTITFSGTAKANSSPSTGTALAPGGIGYAFDNVPIYAAGDGQNYNPLAREVGDIFMCHADEDNIYHRHFLSPALYNYVVNTDLRIIGFFKDMYPIVAPFLITDASTQQTRIIQTSDLTPQHGLQAPSGSAFTVSLTLPLSSSPISLRYDFVYVATFDYPYTIGSFYGTTTTNDGMNAPPAGNSTMGPPPSGNSSFQQDLRRLAPNHPSGHDR